jgi:hypothetical protein
MAVIVRSVTVQAGIVRPVLMRAVLVYPVRV